MSMIPFGFGSQYDDPFYNDIQTVAPWSRAVSPWQGFGSSLAPWQGSMLSPYGQMQQMQQMQNRLAELRNEAVRPMTQLMSADLIESDNDYHVHVDLPGVENLDINTDNGFLTITADRKVKHEMDSDITHTVERSYGKVKRRLPIPFNADVDNAKATFKDGVLTVTFPKKSSTTVKKLTIS